MMSSGRRRRYELWAGVRTLDRDGVHPAAYSAGRCSLGLQHGKLMERAASRAAQRANVVVAQHRGLPVEVRLVADGIGWSVAESQPGGPS